MKTGAIDIITLALAKNYTDKEVSEAPAEQVLTGYTIASTAALPAATDTINEAIGKLAKQLTPVGILKSSGTVVSAATAGTDYLNTSDIIDTLVSTSTTDALSANQGKILNSMLVSYVNVLDATNTFACDITLYPTKSFYFTIADSTAKTITFTNVPTGRCEVFLEITASATAAMTWTLNGGTVGWSLSIAPVLTSGYVYRIMLITNDSGTTWDGYLAGGVA